MRYFLEFKKNKEWKSCMFYDCLDLKELKNIVEAQKESDTFRVGDLTKNTTKVLSKKQVLEL